MAHILFADDQSGTRRLAQGIFSRVFSPLEISTASGAEDAIAAYREIYAAKGQPPDAVFTDLNMPMKEGQSPQDGAGLVVIRVIHKIHPQVPLFVVSGSVDNTLIARAKEAGASYCIDKMEFVRVKPLSRLLQQYLPAPLFRTDHSI